MTKAGTTGDVIDDLLSPQRFSPLSGMPAMAFAGTAALRHASGDEAAWVGASFCGAFLLLGGRLLVFRGRRGPNAGPSGNPSN